MTISTFHIGFCAKISVRWIKLLKMHQIKDPTENNPGESFYNAIISCRVFGAATQSTPPQLLGIGLLLTF